MRERKDAAGEAHMMRQWWDRRARANAFHYVETSLWTGDVDKFFALGEDRARLLIDPVLQRRGDNFADGTAIDLGCGLGRFSRALAGRFAKVIGIDVSGEMVERASGLNPTDRYPNLEFTVGDGLSLPVADRIAALVFSYEVIQHMPSLAVVEHNLREVARVLTPNGLALLHFNTGPAQGLFSKSAAAGILPSWLRARLGRDPLAGDPTFRGAGPIPPSQLSELCGANGLALVSVEPDPTHQAGTRSFVVATIANARPRAPGS